MHELSVTADILETVLNEISSGNYEKVTGVNIVIGDLSGIVGDNVEYYFKLLSEDTPASDANLRIQYKKSKFKCHNCGKIYERCDFSMLCPRCCSGGVIVDSRISLYIQSIEVR